MKRSAIYLLLTGLIVVLFSSPGLAAAPPLTVQINGTAVDTPADMNVVEGQVMVPLRWAAEQLGASSVHWESVTRTITVKTSQDFYNIEKLASYASGLQSIIDEQDEQIWPLPVKAQNLNRSYVVPNRKWVLNLNRYKPQQLNPIQPPGPITICIVSDDGIYEHSSVANSAENRQDHFYLPMDWLEYLFKARVNYNEAANVFSIQTPDPDQIKSEIALIENTLIPSSADEAIKLWGRGEQVRNGALQYLALSPQLRQEADKSAFVRQSYWVTGSSSPGVGPITIINRDELSDTKVEYTLSFPEITSNPPHTTATEKLVAEELTVNGREGWYITQILLSSGYGIIEGLYRSNSLYLTADRISLPFPAKWTIDYRNSQKTINDEQGHSIGALEELGGYCLPNHRGILSDKKLAGGLGESHLLVLLYQSPAAAEIQESWPEVHAMIPLKDRYWLDIWIKVSPGDDVQEVQKLLENAILGAVKTNPDDLYENNKLGFSLLIPKDFTEAVGIKAEEDVTYFVDKEIQAMYPEQIFGVVGRIEVYDKAEFSKKTMMESGDAYGLKYLGENEAYLFGWAHATDVQVPPGNDQLLNQFRSLEKEFGEILKTFKIIDTSELNSSNEPEQLKDNFYKSVNYDPGQDLLSFTIPEMIPEGYRFYLHVSGRIYIDDKANGLSFHAFDLETQNYSWVNGKTYTYSLKSANLDECILVFGLTSPDNQEHLYTIHISPDGTKSITNHNESAEKDLS